MDRRAFLALAALLCLAAPAAGRAADPFQLATMDQVQGWITAHEAVVYDVNPDDVYAKNHLPGARFVTGKQWTAGLPSDKGARLVFYCAGPR